MRPRVWLDDPSQTCTWAHLPGTSIAPTPRLALLGHALARVGKSAGFAHCLHKRSERPLGQGAISDPENPRKSLISKLVRKGGFEPPRSCERQPLKQPQTNVTRDQTSIYWPGRVQT